MDEIEKYYMKCCNRLGEINEELDQEMCSEHVYDFYWHEAEDAWLSMTWEQRDRTLDMLDSQEKS